MEQGNISMKNRHDIPLRFFEHVEKSLHCSLAFLISKPESISDQPINILITLAIGRVVPSMQPFLSPSLWCLNWCHCNGGYFSETSLRSRIPPARPRDPVIHIKPQAPKVVVVLFVFKSKCQVGNKEQSLSPEPRLNGECWDTVTLALSTLNWSG